MLIFLFGSDTFNSHRQLKKMTAKFKAERDPQELNVAVLDCERETPDKIWEQILATAFLAEKRLVVLKNLLLSKHKELQTALLKRLEEKKLPEENVLIFWESASEFKNPEAKALAARLQKEKFAQQFEPPTGLKLKAWINQELKERTGKINVSALNYLTENAGTDIWLLGSLLAQLLAYKNGEEITVADIALFLEQKIDDSIFNLVDAIVAKQPQKVFQMMREQYRLGKDPGYIFVMILRQFKILLELRDLYEREDKLTSDQIAKKLGLHPFVVKKSLPMIKRYTMAELKNIYQQLLDIDIKTKTGQGDQSIMLDLFVGKMIT